MRSQRRYAWPIALASVLVAASSPACATLRRDRAWISERLSARLGDRAAPALPEPSDEGAIPPGVDLADGLDADEAAAIALWNDPVFRIDLVRLDTARADLDEASRPANPRFSAAGPIGPIAGALTLLAPLESLWQLPQRTEAASRELESVAESLVQSGLDTARTARIALVERALAEARVGIRRELAEIAIELARIARVRADAGDISPAEAAGVEGDAAVARDMVRVAEADAVVARARLRVALGLPREVTGFAVHVDPPRRYEPPPVRTLLSIARRSRPDVRAAELSLAGAAARAGWERTRVLALSAQAEAQWTEQTGMGVRVGGQIELPIFGANPGGIGRADAEVERARLRVELARLRVTGEVVEAHAQLVQALESRARYRRDVLPPLAEALAGARRSYELGEEAYVVVLDALRRDGEARLRAAELEAQVRRARAALERAIGGRLEARAERGESEEVPR